ncbi:hypothetical protein C8R42DRAFT_639021 [Lentinula raphanica]|nr:hypothetical protein C8R42DRAFT_724006 [Lentinula raphanica]KAJ3727951.1 hypothetical protein C8R42DRAFT_639021 [Lentinula raphanica]
MALECSKEDTMIFVETKHEGDAHLHLDDPTVPLNLTFLLWSLVRILNAPSLDKAAVDCNIEAEYEDGNDSNGDEISSDVSCFSAGIVFASTKVTMSGHPRKPERFAKALPVKLMVLYVQGSVLVLVAALEQKNPGIILPGHGEFNDTFLEWEIQRRGQDLRLDLTETHAAVQTHLRFSFPSKSEYLSFKQCVSLSIQNQRALSFMDKAYSNRDWILKLFEALS